MKCNLKINAVICLECNETLEDTAVTWAIVLS